MWRLGVLAIPLAEVAAFVLVGGWIGLWATLGLVVLAALAGALLLRRQGAETMRALRLGLGRGSNPAAALLKGGLGLVAGVLLILPGFLSDLLALALLLPPVQRTALRGLSRRVAGQGVGQGAGRGAWTVRTGGPFARSDLRPGFRPDPRSAPTFAAPPEPGDVVDAEWEEVAPPRPSSHPSSHPTGPAPATGPSPDRPTPRAPRSGWTRD